MSGKLRAAPGLSQAAKRHRSESEGRLLADALGLMSDLVAEIPESDRFSERGKLGVKPRFLPCAHRWGLAYVQAWRMAMTAEHEKYGRMWDANAEDRFKNTREKKAYVDGYAMWHETADSASDPRIRELLIHTRDLNHASVGQEGAKYFRENDLKGTILSDKATLAERRQAVRAEAEAAWRHWTGVVQPQETRVAAVAAAAAQLKEANDAKPRERGFLLPSRRRPPGPSASAMAAVPMADEEAALSVAVESELPVSALEAHGRFMEHPHKRHAFAPTASLRTTIMQFLREDTMFGVLPAIGDRGPPVFFRHDSDDHTKCSELQEGLFEPYGFESLLGSDEARANPRDETLWPNRDGHAFRDLRLRHVGHGGYNSVWEPTEGVDYANLPFPHEVAYAMNHRATVLRVPMPNAPWLTRDALVDEMVNMAETAVGGYGPLIHAMAWARKKETLRDPRQPRGVREESRYRLIAFLQRGDTNVQARLESERLLRFTPANHVREYLTLLRRAVWLYSADRCVHIDAKVANFVDMCGPLAEGVRIGEGGNVRGAVRVIDVDAQSFRRLYRTPVDATTEAHLKAQGWRPIWLHNILFVSCFIKLYLPENLFVDCWWRQVHGAILRVRTELSTVDPFPDDAEYANAREFVRSCTLVAEGAKSTLAIETEGYYGSDGLPEPKSGGEPHDVATDAARYALFYFHDVWVDWCKRQFILPRREWEMPPASATLDAKQRAQARKTKADDKYDREFRAKYAPMMRFFREQVGENAATAPLLVDVMYRYCTATKQDLIKRYADGQPVGEGVRAWRKLPYARDVKRLFRPDGAHDEQELRRVVGTSG